MFHLTNILEIILTECVNKEMAEYQAVEEKQINAMFLDLKFCNRLVFGQELVRQ